ncbi:type II toxin-antitoxin system RelB/DinJ family antitoxin [Lacticaseibacillus manihotivorans]|jgi:DNA-damage-inducible protein J|uniref:DNA-damage-inducible protein J n=2 Tax=Lacticaseibacillus manihotivorans TaxID=88233 RepID=A0A0R1QTN4_9LACO|nr:type II toxin-antitoxin system RelB/DinJ family antitoxin [Lacticaseibacillus manihotivorans]KRL47887.1 hypothetical protein FD01_GL000197 [Lacticaseibacillus manihotivorans DSM 13343 = JCM 12514]QFQ91846.1 type II toxin-antitoxin system RelB/DinJ family antitoxin [Lacticaseibacillus manihotivorans]
MSSTKSRSKSEVRVTVQARIDKQTKDAAMAAFKAMGMDMSTGISIYLNQVAHDQRMPFTPSAADPLDATLADALADVKAGRVEHADNYAAYKAAMDKL